MPVGGVLVGFRQSEHFGFAEEFANKGDAGGISFFVEAVGDADARMAGEIGDPSV
jgi:hypothetical protein